MEQSPLPAPPGRQLLRDPPTTFYLPGWVPLAVLNPSDTHRAGTGGGAGRGVLGTQAGWWPHQGDTSVFPNSVSSSKSRASRHKPNSPGHQVLEFKVTLIYYQLLAPLLSLRLSPLTHFIIYASLGLSTWEHHGEVIAK